MNLKSMKIGQKKVVAAKGPTSYAVKNVKKTVNNFMKELDKNKIKYSFSNPYMNFNFEIDGKHFELYVHDNWMNVRLSSGSEVGSAPNDMGRVMEQLLKKLGKK